MRLMLVSVMISLLSAGGSTLASAQSNLVPPPLEIAPQSQPRAENDAQLGSIVWNDGRIDRYVAISSFDENLGGNLSHAGELYEDDRSVDRSGYSRFDAMRERQQLAMMRHAEIAELAARAELAEARAARERAEARRIADSWYWNTPCFGCSPYWYGGPAYYRPSGFSIGFGFSQSWGRSYGRHRHRGHR